MSLFFSKLQRVVLVAGVAFPSFALAGAGTPQYPVAALPSSLRENAHAVVRRQDESLAVKSVGRTVETTRRAVTVLDEAGSQWATEVVYYDKLNTITYFRGTVYDEAGRVVRQLRTADIHDISLSDGFSLATDARGRTADLRQPSYPYTVEFEYEVVSDNPLFYSTWRPQPAEQLAVEQATFRVLTPTSLPLRFQERHLPSDGALVRSKQGALDVFQWQVRNLAAIEDEADSPPVSELAPMVLTAPTEFEVEGYHGRLSSWQDLSKWTYDLNAGRDVLPPAIQAQMAALGRGEKDERARIRKVYEYLQANTRYISIQLGIGGWQTFPASSVAANGYGDCKALTNYCKALLQAAGVTSYAALVRAGSTAQDIRTDFPSSQFNHVVLCVPLTSTRPDTVWLECTDQTNPFGYMSSFTGNRHALLLLPQGGRLVATPRYGAAENRRERRADVHFDLQGNATASIRTRHTGLEFDAIAGLTGLAPSEQKKRLGDRLPLPSFTITKFSLTPDESGAVPVLTENLTLAVPALAPPNGKRVFITPNLLCRTSAPRATVGERRTDIWLSHAYTYTDTVRLHIPAGFRPEQLPAPVKLATPFGDYLSQVQVMPDGNILYIRRLLMPNTRFSRTDYPAYLDFRRRVSAADKAQVVLVKTEA
ncbi:DUF3857 domain-containing protein [Hymenobacter sp. AT01-02]|uniref:DUF3857 domain-containing protein n=1 Tax=Hymenobacter sp. AT01-02 TaxID=1571877 RepID=UPI0009EBEB86|nr:DUF3857 domain-containing protein [Hymenobacter sp. AT01-02]